MKAKTDNHIYHNSVAVVNQKAFAEKYPYFRDGQNLVGVSESD